jgi:hypothetical protein
MLKVLATRTERMDLPLTPTLSPQGRGEGALSRPGV